MASADDQIYAAESGGVLQRLDATIAARQRRAEGIISSDEAARTAESQAAADKDAETQAEAGVGTEAAGGVGLTASLVRGVLKAGKAAKALGRVKQFIAERGAPAEGPEPSAPSAPTVTAEDPEFGAEAFGPEFGLRGEVVRVGETQLGGRLAPPDAPDPTPDPAGQLGDDIVDAGRGAASELRDQLASKAASGADFLESAAGRLGIKGDLGELLSATPEELGSLAGGVGADIAGGSTLASIAGTAAEALGPAAMFAGVGLGIYSAWEETKQENTAKSNAEKYNDDINALSAAPELSTGSIAMPVMDSTAFRSGGAGNF